MREISYSQAIREAMCEEMRKDPSVFLMGEDVGIFNGVWGVSAGMLAEFGEEHVRDTPITEEGAIIGSGLGAAMVGMRPIVEIMFADFMMCAGDQIVNQVAKAKFMSGGKAHVPLTIRVATGAPGSSAAQHSQSAESWFMNIPGLKMVCPATPADAKGLLKTALRGDDPVIFFEHKMLYDTIGPVPEEEYSIPFGEANIVRQGKDVTIIAIGLMVSRSLEAAKALTEQGIDAEVIDMRTLVPMDKETLIKSVAKTNHAVIVHEAHVRAGPGAEIAAVLASEAIEYMDGPILRVGALNVPLPYSPVLEQYVLPGTEDIIKAVKSFWPNK